MSYDQIDGLDDRWDDDDSDGIKDSDDATRWSISFFLDGY